MTKFFNLESYLECCQYAEIFRRDSHQLIPSQKENALPLAYKNFWQDYHHAEFLPFPAVVSSSPQKLKPRSDKLPKQQLGFSIADDNEETIFIIRPANFLGLRSLQASYFFANVYSYWSYASQLQKYAQSNKPMIIYDFDSFTPNQIIPLTFETHPHAPFPIPIIDTRRIEAYQKLKLSTKYETIYDNICSQIAEKIIAELHFENSNKQSIINHLKKINIFSVLKNHQNLSIILELKQKFYHYQVKIKEITNIISNQFPVTELINLIKANAAQYNFVIISSYPLISLLSSENLIIPNLSQNEFTTIWQQAKNKSFPLYGQNLDEISFFVRSQEYKQVTEIKLPSQTCYQGEKEVTVYGEYYSQSQNQTKTDFPLTQQKVILPFKINGQHLINDDKEQIYQIENQYFNQTPEEQNNKLAIKIRFRLKPGVTPKLEVIDQHKRILQSSLEDKKELHLGYIPFENINQYRYETSTTQLEILKNNLPTFKEKLQSLYYQLSSNANLINKKAEYFNNFYDQNINILPTIYILKENQQLVLDTYKQGDSLFQNLFEEMINRNQNNTIDSNLQIINKAYRNILLFLGKSYALTQNMSLDFLFDENRIKTGKVRPFNLYLQNIARMSCTKSRQKQFINLFYSDSRSKQKKFYQIDDYLWGYARILLWYLHFNAKTFLNYQQHFADIISYCLAFPNVNNKNRAYLQNALIALIYLLTFREYNDKFVTENSEVYNRAKQLCNQLTNDPIRSKKLHFQDNISLNELFEKLLDGKATQQQVNDMIKIDD